MEHVGFGLFVATLVVAYLLPGPDMAVVVSTSSASGKTNGLLVALGLAASRSLHVALSAIGLGAVFKTHPVLFEVIRWVGVGYLFWIAWKVFRLNSDAPLTESAGNHAGLVAFRRGFLTNLLNPKAFMFCALLLPQFIATEAPLLFQYLVLGSLLVIIGLLFDVVFAIASCQLSRRSEHSKGGYKILRTVFSTFFLVAAIRLAFA